MPKKNADEQDDLRLRIADCLQVVNDLENNKAWQVVNKDLEEERKQLDDNWQTIWDNDKLLAARVLKFACKHILDLKDKYKEEATQNKQLLRSLENPDKEVLKDYDNE